MLDYENTSSCTFMSKIRGFWSNLHPSKDFHGTSCPVGIDFFFFFWWGHWIMQILLLVPL